MYTLLAQMRESGEKIPIVELSNDEFMKQIVDYFTESNHVEKFIIMQDDEVYFEKVMPKPKVKSKVLHK